MFWFIIAGIIVAVLTIYTIWEDGFSEGLAMLVAGVLMGGFIACVLNFVVGIFATPFVETHKIETSQPLYSIVDDRQTEGRYSRAFFLGTGTVQEEDYIYYYTENERGKYIDKFKLADCYFQDSDNDPKMVVYSTFPVKEPFWFFWYLGSGETYTVFYIPKDTVKIEYNVDMFVE